MFCFILALNTNHGKCPEGVRYIYEGNEPTIMDKVYIDEVHTKDVKFYGSFCAPVTGNYKFHIKGQSAITLKLGTINMNKHIDICATQDVNEYYTINLIANRCYPFEAKITDGCITRNSFLKLWYFLPGDNVEREVSTANKVLLSCDRDDCEFDHYGSDCTNTVEYPFGAECSMSNGTNGDGRCLRCPEDASCYAGVYHNYRDTRGQKTQARESTVSFIEDEPYSEEEHTGAIVIKEEGSYTFRLVTNTYASIKIGSYGYYNLNEPFPCEIKTQEKNITGWFNRGYENFAIKSQQGCPVVPKISSFQWMKEGEESFHDFEPGDLILRYPV